jgi:hypothetical protein
MLSSLNPVAERARGHRPAATASWYVLGAAAGGLALGAACAGVAFVVDLAGPSATVRFAVALAAAALTVASDAGATAWSLPEHPRQVNERWLSDFRRWVYAAGFGAQIGSGFATYIMTAATYLTAVLATLCGPRDALLVGLVFGVARGSEVLVGLRATTPDRLRRIMAGIERRAGVSLAVAIAAQLGVGITAAAAAGGPVAAGVFAVVGVALVVPRLRVQTVGA